MVNRDFINYVVAKTFKFYDKNFVNELARLLILYGSDFKIDTPNRLALFLANVKAEISINKITRKVRMREKMNYSAKRLMKVFKVFRHNKDLAYKYGFTFTHKANEVMIANIAYANRLGNGDIDSGDGYRYRGAGILQTTGKKEILADLKLIEKKIGIKLIDKNGNVYDGILDSYFGGILLGFAYWYRNKMYEAKNIDETVDILNYYTDSRKKRKKFYTKISKTIMDFKKQNVVA